MLNIQDADTFSWAIERLVAEHHYTYIEALQVHTEFLGLDAEDVPKLLNRVVKEKLKCEAIDLHILRGKRTKKIPIG